MWAMTMIAVALTVLVAPVIIVVTHTTITTYEYITYSDEI